MEHKRVSTEKQGHALQSIEHEIASGRSVPNTVEIARHLECGHGEVASILDALQYLGCITRIPGRRRNIRLCSPAVKMASDDQLIAELNSRGYLIRKVR